MDSKFPDFESDAKNLRLGLSSDGMNSHSSMSSTHSVGPRLQSLFYDFDDYKTYVVI